MSFLNKVRNKSTNKQKIKILFVSTFFVTLLLIVVWYFLNSFFGAVKDTNQANVADETVDSLKEISDNILNEFGGLIEDFNFEIQ